MCRLLEEPLQTDLRYEVCLKIPVNLLTKRCGISQADFMKKAAPIALIYTAIILTLMEYFFIPPRAEVWLSGNRFTNWPVPSMDAGIVWAGSCLIGFFGIPAILVYFFSGSNFRDHGLNFAGFKEHFKTYVGLYLLMVPLIYLASRQPEFRNTYPFIPEARNSLSAFLLWELAYVLQFFALEFFFRGYVLFTLERHMEKWTAICVMLVPYVMIHFHKPVFECLGATIAGLVLGHLALKYRSWLGGAILHALVGVTLDSLATWA